MRDSCREDERWTDETGAELGWRWTPIAAAGLYVPGGLASYPSSVLMNAIPAKVAGVGRLALAVPMPRGEVNPLVLYACRLAGVDEIYRIGGAQAIAALAYGTETIRPVDKITGPGNAYVAAAKRRVFGKVGIDMIAGPSEILVISDGTADPDWLALDLLSQAEHDESAQAILITTDAGHGRDVAAAVERRLRNAAAARDRGRVLAGVRRGDRRARPRRGGRAFGPDRARASGAVRGGSRGASCSGSATLARCSWATGPRRRSATTLAGPNHVLPTARSARFSSGLSVLDFVKRTTLARMTPAALARIGGAAETLARAEGLEAHGLSVQCPPRPAQRGRRMSRITRIEIDDRALPPPTPEIEQERRVAVFDLLEDNSFALCRARRARDGARTLFAVAVDPRTPAGVRRADRGRRDCRRDPSRLGPFRQIVKDYFQICESYFSAVKTLPPSQIETIDMARRGIHNEGARVLQERLTGKADVDIDTARRLFTLICVLHFGG